MRSMLILLPFKHLLGVKIYVMLGVFFLCTPKMVSQQLLSTTSVGEERARGTRFVGKDILDNSYWITGNVVRKSKGANVLSFQEFGFGNVSSVDITNPMQLGVFYKDYNVWVNVDEHLVLVNQYDFSELLPVYEVAFVANSVKNTLWIVDEVGRSINRYYPQTNRINKLYTLVREEVRDYYSDVNHLYWITEDYRLKGIDIYGNELLDVSIPKYDLFQVINAKSALYSFENKVFYLNFEKNEHLRIDIKEQRVLAFFYNTQKLSIFGNRILSNYQLKLS